MPINAQRNREFSRKVKAYYRRHGRILPWRKTRDPYKIVVSEIMLQQTQVSRVLEKYPFFIAVFPDLRALARAPLRKVLKAWQGLGYNRRARALHQLAKAVVREHDGRIPADKDALLSLSGIGEATACSVRAFAFGRGEPFIETNIRSVFIHEFFSRRRNVSDKEILPLVEATLDRCDPRTWYSALMDYGFFLKGKFANPSRKSSHYKRQSPFQGSDRQMRGKILKILSHKVKVRQTALADIVGGAPERVAQLIRQLQREKLIRKKGVFIFL
ncbi:A/G-specific adenine glycosylase [Candidatus Omnitrophota bacterium]